MLIMTLDDIGAFRHGSVAANELPQARRNSNIYMDKSIKFEDYHYCMRAITL